MQSQTKTWKYILGLNITLGIIQIIGMFTDFEFENPYLNLFFPVFVTILALVTIRMFPKSEFNNRRLKTLVCIPSLAAGLPYFLLFILFIFPTGWYAADLAVNNFTARSVLKEVPSPDETKIAIVYYNPPMEGGNIRIETKLKYKYLPFVVRYIHEEWIDFDWEIPHDPNFKYNLTWIDNEKIQAGEDRKQLNVSKVKLVMPEIIAAFFSNYE